MDTHNIFRELRVKAGLKQQDVAEAMGVNRTAVSHWETGATRPDSGKLPELARLLNCSVSAFFGEDAGAGADEDAGGGALATARVAPVRSMATVPLVTLGHVHAGDFFDEEPIGRTVEIPAHVLEAHPNAQAVIVEGDCMNRVIPGGYIAVFDPDLEPTNGRIAIVETEDHQALMRRWYKGQDKLFLTADSHQPFADIVIEGDAPIRVIGTVVHAVVPDDLL